MSVSLRLPGLDLAADYLAALAEGFHAADQRVSTPAEIAAIAADLPGHLAGLNRQSADVVLLDGSLARPVPFIRLWLADGPRFLGAVRIRYQLNAWFRNRGGHIGYAIRPDARGRGLAQLALRLCLDHAIAVGHGRVLLTCDDENLASAHIIERAGGLLDYRGPSPYDSQRLFRRYWINLER